MTSNPEREPRAKAIAIQPHQAEAALSSWLPVAGIMLLTLAMLSALIIPH